MKVQFQAANFQCRFQGKEKDLTVKEIKILMQKAQETNPLQSKTKPPQNSLIQKSAGFVKRVLNNKRLMPK